MKKTGDIKNQGLFAKKITKLRDLKVLQKNGVPNVSSSLMQKIEREGHIPSNTTIGKLCKALGDGKPELLEELTQLADKERDLKTQQSDLCQKRGGQKQVEDNGGAQIQDEFITFDDMADRELFSPITSPIEIKQLVENYLKLLLKEFDAAFRHRQIDPQQEKRRKKGLISLQKQILKECRFPGRVIYLLQKYQAHETVQKLHKVSANEIGDLLLNGGQPGNGTEFIGLPPIEL